MTRCRLATFWIASVYLSVFVLQAQTGGTGAISGIVTDASGAVVPDAEVKVTNVATAETRRTQCSGDGRYLVSLLPPGAYRVDISKSGFKALSFPRVEVNVTETATLNAQLQVGAVTEQVTVAADTQQLQTASAALGRVTNEKMVVDLPLAARNFTQIVGLNPGVSAEVNNATDLGRGGGGMSNFSTGGGSIKDTKWMEWARTTSKTAGSSVGASRFRIPTRFRSSGYRLNNMTPAMAAMAAPTSMSSPRAGATAYTAPFGNFSATKS